MINTNTNSNTTNPWLEKIQYIKRQNRVPNLPTPQSGQIQNCRRCGNKFLPGHLNICPAINESCRICKTIGHFAKLCKSEMPPQPQYNIQQRRQQRTTTTKEQPTGNETNITKAEKRERRRNRRNTVDNSKTIDPESTCYIREMMEDWQKIKFIQSVKFKDEKVTDINKTKRGKFWIQTKTDNKQTYWLADTGSPRSFMNIETAHTLRKTEPQI